MVGPEIGQSLSEEALADKLASHRRVFSNGMPLVKERDFEAAAALVNKEMRTLQRLQALKAAHQAIEGQS